MLFNLMQLNDCRTAPGHLVYTYKAACLSFSASDLVDFLNLACIFPWWKICLYNNEYLEQIFALLLKMKN